jgi:PAS domain S-box-containing protein
MAQPATAAAAPLEADLRAAMDRIVADSLGLGTAAVALLFTFFAAVDPFINPDPWRWQIAVADAACAATYGFMALVAWRGGIDPRHAHGFALAAALIAVTDMLHDTLLLGDPRQTVYVMLTLVAAGSIFLSVRWFLPLVGVGIVGTVGVAILRPSPDWNTFGFALVAAGAIGLLIQAVRVRTYRRLEVLRLAAERAGTERDLREQALESAVRSAWESEERYRRLVEQAPDAFLVHSEGKVVYANAAAAKLLGATSTDDLIGRDSLSFVHAEDRETIRGRNQAIEKEGVSTEPMETKIVRLDGSVVDVETTGQPILYMGRVADQTVIRDMTDRKRAEAERTIAIERLAEISRLKEMDRMKTQFVNTLSHELRTPLTPIKVQLHLLKAAHVTGDKDKEKRATDMLERNVLRMGSLIDELLEVARLQAGTLKLDKGPMGLDEAVTEALDSFRDVAKASGIDVQTKVTPGLTIDADGRRLTQVMYNLLNNALKFTPKGGLILVEASKTAEGRARVSVTDSGIGIKPEDIQRLFEPFSQLHDTMQKTNAGTGLGLYICKGIVEGHDGRIWCESPGPGKGSTFAFEVPLIRAKTA